MKDKLVVQLSPIQLKKLEALLEQGAKVRACTLELYIKDRGVCTIDAYGHVEWRS